MKHEKIIFRIAWFFVITFLCVIGYLIQFTMVESKTIALHPTNKRLDHLAGEVVRGTIYDAEGNVLAEEKEGQRVYPYAALYAHAVGYSQRGKYGAEALANVQLLYPDYTFESLLKYAFKEEKFPAHDVVLTIRHDLQETMAAAIGDRKGAAIVLEPTTGKILGMYSNPGFDPNKINEQWEHLSGNEADSPLLNRATQGLYPPASVFKIVTTLAYLQETKGTNEVGEPYTCTGSIKKDGHTITCYDQTAHGKLDLEQAFAKSCNTYFINMSNTIEAHTLEKTARQVLFGEALPTNIPYSKSQVTRMSTGEEKTFNELASYIGQGDMLASPLHLAMLAGLIYNDGIMMEPYLVDYSVDNAGEVAFKNLPTYKGAIIQEEASERLSELMIEVVQSGTAKRIQQKGITIGGKTGTAQNETGIDHSWFVGFAETKEGNQTPIAYAIMIEQGGKGAKALDVAEKIIQVYFN